MRLILLFILGLTACSQEARLPDLAAGNYSGEGRNRLCIAGEGAARRGGVIAYGPADTNCSASGRLEPSETGFVLIPAGDSECRIALSVIEDVVRIGKVPTTCSYYCGPGATLAGKSFTKDSAATQVTDLVGDPLC